MNKVIGIKDRKYEQATKIMKESLNMLIDMVDWYKSEFNSPATSHNKQDESEKARSFERKIIGTLGKTMNIMNNMTKLMKDLGMPDINKGYTSKDEI